MVESLQDAKDAIRHPDAFSDFITGGMTIGGLIGDGLIGGAAAGARTQ